MSSNTGAEPTGPDSAAPHRRRGLAIALLVLAAGAPAPLPASDLGGHLPFLRGPLTSPGLTEDLGSEADTVVLSSSDLDSDAEAEADSAAQPDAQQLAGRALAAPLVAEFMGVFAAYALESHRIGLEPQAPATPLTSPRLVLLKGLRWGCRESLRLELAAQLAPQRTAWLEAGGSLAAFRTREADAQAAAAARQEQALRQALSQAAESAGLPTEALDGFRVLPGIPIGGTGPQAPTAAAAAPEETKAAPPADTKPGSHQAGC